MSDRVRTIADYADGPDRSVAAALHRLRDADPTRGIWFEQELTPWPDAVAATAVRIAALRELLAGTERPHVGVLLSGTPEYLHLLAAAACSEIVVAGLNPTRRGEALARDVTSVDCGLVVVDSDHAAFLDGLDLRGPGGAPVPVISVDSPEWAALLERHAGATLPEPATAPTGPDDLVALIFTSGTSGDPKAVRITQAKIAVPGRMLADRFGIGPDDCVYSSMPLFHSNAVMVAWPIAVFSGCSIALRPRFSASGWLADVRRYGCTFANYVGAPLSYVLATREYDDDADNPMRVVYGNEAPPDVRREFARRFGVTVVDGFGSSEGGLSVTRTPDTPESALGPLPAGAAVVDPETGVECPRARFGAGGGVENADEAVGELVGDGPGLFAGYYEDPAADAERMRDGRFWTGDLAYVDADGYVYFAGRSSGWMRVDGENLAAAPIERVLLRHPDVAEVGVYAVPAAAVAEARAAGDGHGSGSGAGAIGDAVACAVVLRADSAASAADAALGGADHAAADALARGFGDFLAAQTDLGPKQWPTLLRVTAALPRTASFKFRARDLTDRGTAPAGDRLYLRAADGFRPCFPV